MRVFGWLIAHGFFKRTRFTRYMIRSSADLRSWLDCCVLGDLRTLVAGIDAYYGTEEHVDAEGRPIGAANFLLVAGCCSAIEYFGYLLNEGTTQEARSLAFINRFLGQVDSKYSEVGKLFWQCFRHGTVHRSWPKRIYLASEKVSIAAGAGAAKSDPHLASALGREGHTFLVNGRRLLLDLSIALDGPFGEWIESNATEALFERANPEGLRIAVGDQVLTTQARNVLAWKKTNYRSV